MYFNLTKLHTKLTFAVIIQKVRFSKYGRSLAAKVGTRERFLQTIVHILNGKIV